MFRRTAVLALLMLLLATPAGASAEEFFAGPASIRTTAPCEQNDPCQLDTVLSLSGLGDTVRLLPGEYFQSGTTPWPNLPDLKAGAVLLGDDPAQPPVIHGLGTLNATPFLRVGTGATLQDVEIEMTADPVLTFSYAVSGSTGSVINRVRIDAVNPGAVSLTACQLSGTTIRNSVCRVSGSGSSTALIVASVGSDFTTNVSNTTAISTGTTGYGMRVGISSADTSTLNVSNSIARGPTSDLNTGTFTGMPPTGTAVINVHHSNWNTYSTTGNGTNQLNQGAGNQTGATAATPVFVDGAAGDYRQVATSPTIDAGLGSGLTDPLTLEASVRIFGPAPDIGAYEFVPPPVATTAAASGIQTDRATLNGSVDPNGSATSAIFEYGTTTAYGQTIDLPAIDFSGPETPVSAALTGLRPNTTYHYRVSATSIGGGTSNGADSTFTTPAVATPGNALSLSGLRVKKKWNLRKGAVVRFRLSRDATVRLVFERKQGKRFVRRGIKVVEGKAGLNKVRIKRKLKGNRKLRPGRYRLKASATAVDGMKSLTRKVRFRITR